MWCQNETLEDSDKPEAFDSDEISEKRLGRIKPDNECFCCFRLEHCWG